MVLKQIALRHCVAEKASADNGDRAGANRVFTLYRQMPTRTGAGLHLQGDRRGLGPEVFFEYRPPLGYDESLHP